MAGARKRSVDYRPRLRLGGVARTVVGVMPRGFWFPSPTIRIWIAAQLSRERRVGNLTLVGRVVPGATVEHMQAPLSAMTAELGRQYKYPPEWDKTRAPAIKPLRESLVGDVRTGLLATLAAMALILLIASVNVAALMLGQVSGRSTELAVRTALGAGRRRLVQQVVARGAADRPAGGRDGRGVAALRLRRPAARTAAAILLSLLAALALLLGAVGVYGMISHFVTRRAREYGIRLALGLSPGHVVTQVLGRGLRLVAAGTAVGVVAALALTRLLASMLYGVEASDPRALAGAVAALLVAGALAAFIPARRASRTDPAFVLRQQ
jgi:ABC-type antimicrobial peptide transport system permease subunit